MNYLFWNTHNNTNINHILKDLIKQYRCDVVALAEYKANIRELLDLLDKEGINLYHVKQIGCTRIHILTKFVPEKIEALPETSRYTIKKIPHDDLIDTIVAFVHLPSKLHANSYDLLEQVRYLKQDIEEMEEKLDCKNTIVMGDFNMNPFEDAMISASGLHSLSCKDIANKNTRTVSGRPYSMFYNPMWNLLGDNVKPVGSYYYSDSSIINYFWNIFDQVIIRPELSSHFKLNKLCIVNKIGDTSLIDKNKKPNKNISDHLPIFFEI